MEDGGAKIIKLPLPGCPTCGEKIEPRFECIECSRPQCSACYSEEEPCLMCTYLEGLYKDADPIEEMWKADDSSSFDSKWAKEDDYALKDKPRE